MRGFIRHSADCSIFVERIEVSHPGALVAAEEGELWTEVPLPASDWTVELDGEGAVVTVPFARPAAVALALAKQNVRFEVKARREKAEFGGCNVAGIGRFQTDPDSRSKVNGAALMAVLGGSGFEIDWRLADDSLVTLNAEQMIAVGLAIGQHVAACQYRKNALDASIDAAATAEVLEAIDIEAGWP